jgi:hypothetical protein
MKLIIPLFLACVTLSSASQTNRVTLEWDPNSETNLAGYVVMWGTNTSFSSNGPVLFTSPLITTTNYSFTNLVWNRTYSFAVKAVDTDGLDSDPSNEVLWKASRLNKPGGLKKSVSVIVNVTITP